MLAKKNRLTRKQINFLYRKGKTQNFGVLSIKVMSNKLELSRFSVVIPKTLYKKATERNRLRRIIFEALFTLKFRSNIDCLIRLHKTVEEGTLKDIISSLPSRIYV